MNAPFDNDEVRGASHTFGKSNIMPEHALPSNYAELFTAYQYLTAKQQITVQFLSVLYESDTRQNLVRALFALGIADPKYPSKPLPITTLHQDFIQPLLKAGLIVEQNSRIHCTRLFCELATRQAIVEQRFEAIAAVISSQYPTPNGYYRTKDQIIREARIAFYRQDWEKINAVLALGRRSSNASPDEITFYLMVCGTPFESAWFCKLPLPIFESLLLLFSQKAMAMLEPRDPIFDLLHAHCTESANVEEILVYHVLMEIYILHGEWAAAQQLAQGHGSDVDGEMLALAASVEFLRTGQSEAVLEQFQIALALLQKNTRKRRKVYFNTVAGVLFLLALVQRNDAASLRLATDYVAIAQKADIPRFNLTYDFLADWLHVLHGDKASRANILEITLALPWENQNNGLPKWTAQTNFFLAFIKFWVDAEQTTAEFSRIAELQRHAADSGYAWIAVELAELLAALAPTNKTVAAHCQRTREAFPAQRHSLLEVHTPKPAWETALTALINLHNPAGHDAMAEPGNDIRLVWLLRWNNSSLSFEAREQKILAKGNWSKGRQISLKRLYEDGDSFDFLTPQDRKAIGLIRKEQNRGYYGYYETDYTTDSRMALALAGHPLLFWADNPEVRVDLSKGTPELRVSKLKDNRLHISLHPMPQHEDQEIVVLKDSPTRLKAVELSAEHLRILEVLGDKGLEAPESAKEQVLQAISSIAPLITVHSDIGGGTENAEAVPADSTPRMHLLPFGAGLKASLLVRPFSNGGPHYPPGSGGETVVAEVDGKRLQTRRDLKEEKKRANTVLAACPTLARVEEQDGEWLLEEPEDSLELLSELQTVGEHVAVEWPEGQKFRLAGLAGLGQFSMQIHRDNDWFGLSGEVRVGDQEILDMQRLLSLLDRGRGRFVQLEDGQFLALTEEFRKRLEDLRAYSEQHGKKLRIHPLAALSLQDLDEEIADLKTDKHWQEHIRRLREAENYHPELPGTFQAELRDYQFEGFQWLARLAYWGVGGCLADDMGLGKTLQALAVMLLRAPDGPSLVVAPTSVCMNWETEARRFAPTLRVILFGPGDRQKILENLKPYDLLLCSYGLLQQESVAEKLAEVNFQTIVLDEAQAIKNVATKRSQGAMNLQGGFKLITTGTPVENHLGELWNLFRFANPGLLGSLEKFNQRFAGPIERNQDKQARQQLRKLIQPFILRRTKSQVLQELPPRTEIPIHVELSKEETAFYEAVRREALEKLAGLKGPAGQKHLQILSEIMRMRRACCNVKLVSPELSLPSSKLDAFGEILEELLENKHKALVFSQFVDHLSLIRKYLDERKVSYQYLDGSTPQKERKQNVDAFQRGEGDLFLISLKAGGVGLNLTAADYVIHMDPWWNPAVEDQASDRAHRIGQQRPVTIYRLIAKNTIEEKIVDLHQHKRDLADSLLEGADVSGKMSADELLKLMADA